MIALLNQHWQDGREPGHLTCRTKQSLFSGLWSKWHHLAKTRDHTGSWFGLVCVVVCHARIILTELQHIIAGDVRKGLSHWHQIVREITYQSWADPEKMKIRFFVFTILPTVFTEGKPQLTRVFTCYHRLKLAHVSPLLLMKLSGRLDFTFLFAFSNSLC